MAARAGPPSRPRCCPRATSPARRIGVRPEMRADRRLHQAPPPLGIGPRAIEPDPRRRRHQRRVQGQQLRRRRSAPNRRARVLADAGHHPRPAKELEVVGQGDGVARIGQRPEHLRVAQHLSRVRAARRKAGAGGRASRPDSTAGCLGQVRLDDRVRMYSSHRSSRSIAARHRIATVEEMVSRSQPNTSRISPTSNA